MCGADLTEIEDAKKARTKKETEPSNFKENIENKPKTKI